MKTRNFILFLGALFALEHTASGVGKIKSAEYYFDSDPGPGNGIKIEDPQLDLLDENDLGDWVSLSITLDPENPAQPDPNAFRDLVDGFHKLYVRFQDEDGNWSDSSARTFHKGPLPAADTAIRTITAFEYYFDTDPGQGNAARVDNDDPIIGNLIEISAGAESNPLLSHEIPREIEKEGEENIKILDALEPGFHKLFVRVRDSKGDWSVTIARTVFVGDAEPQMARRMGFIRLQWLLDGEEVGEPMDFAPEVGPEESAPSFYEVIDNLNLDNDSLQGGVTAVLRVTPYDDTGEGGTPGMSEYRTVVIEWLDEDNDGFPDQWENQFEEFVVGVVNDKDKDSDQDGLTDWEEFLAGTSPIVQDSDGDGISDFSELKLARYGFNPAMNNADLLADLNAAAIGAGVYATEENIRNLNIDVPVVGRDPETGKIFVKVRVNQSSTLNTTDWSKVTLSDLEITTEDGDIKITIPDLENLNYFFQIFADENFGE